MRILKWIAGISLGLLAVVAALVTSVGWFLSSPVTEETSAKMNQSKQFQSGTFKNQEPEAGFELSLDRLAEQFGDHKRQSPVGEIPVVSLDSNALKSPPAPGMRVAWLGHAGTLVEIEGKRILTDPILSPRASPFPFAGPKRFHKPPIPLQELTSIDAVIISHNHYDHLDRATIAHLAKSKTRVFVPLGNKPQLLAWKVPENLIQEMDWWQEADLDGVKIVATPARHYSSRGLFDYQKTLWASWAVVGDKHRVFFSGDTGYSKVFAKIGKNLGPFDLTIVKVGAYGPGQMWKDIHMPPEESIQTHRDLMGAVMLPVHWGTFDLGHHEWDEPIIRTLTAAGSSETKLITPKVGEMVDPETHRNTNWWEAID